MAKDLRYTLYLDMYSPLLTDKQRETLELYYNEDLSLGEISEVTGITRQGVMNCIKTSETRLSELEEEMGLVERFNSLKEKVERLEAALKNEKLTDTGLYGYIDEIKALL